MKFEIDKALKGLATVTTEQGDSVRILASDVPGMYPIVAYVEKIGDAYGNVHQFTKDGRPQHPHEVGKLILEKKKHKSWVNLYYVDDGQGRHLKVSNLVYESYEDAKNDIFALYKETYLGPHEIVWEA